MPASVRNVRNFGVGVAILCCDSKGARKKTHTIKSGRAGFPSGEYHVVERLQFARRNKPPPVTGRTPPEQHPTYDTPAVIVTAPLPQRLLRKVGDTKQTKRPSPSTCRPSGLPPVTLLPRNAPAFPPAFRPYSCYCSAAALPPGFEPLVYPPPRTDTRRPFNLCHERRD